MLTAYSLVLLIIPISHRLLIHLNAATVDTILNLTINFLIAFIYICLLAFLIKRGSRFPSLSYLWLGGSFIICAYFLMQVEMTTDRLHFLGYGILSLLLYRALRHNIGTKMLYVWSGLFIMLFAILDEALQGFGWGGRSFEFKDIGIDWLSGLTGQFIIAWVVRPKLETIDIKIRKYIKGLKELKTFEATHTPRRIQGFNLDRLAKQICLAFRNITGDNFGHVHFMYKGKDEHLILVCEDQRLEKIVAKGRHCKKGECIRWHRCGFSCFSPREAFLKFLPRVGKIVIEHPSIQKSWHSFNKFQNWLNQAGGCPYRFS